MTKSAPKPLSPVPPIRRKPYARELRRLQIALVKLHRKVIADGRKVLIVLEGRDAAGKDGTIKRVAAHLSPREVRVVALGKPSDREETQWYFQRFVPHLPSAQEIVFFNRSWYNRAGVELVMGFCTKQEAEVFLDVVPRFERMLVRSGVVLLKYYLDITHGEQQRRLQSRARDPLKQWKISPVDKAAQRHWSDYSRARNDMLNKTSHKAAPWVVIRADNKRQARLNVIRDILSRIPYPQLRERPDGRVARQFSRKLISSGWIAP